MSPVRIQRFASSLLFALILFACAEGPAAPPAPRAVASVLITPSVSELVVGQTVALGASGLDAGGEPVAGRPVEWRSSRPEIATVSASGLVEALAEGSVSIVATIDGREGSRGFVVSPAVEAPPPVAAVELDASSLALVAGASRQLTATVRDAAGRPLEGIPVGWSSSDVGVAAVSGSGLVSGVRPGTATVRAAAGGRHAELLVTVTPATNPTHDLIYTSWTASVGNAVYPQVHVLDMATGEARALPSTVGVSQVVPSPDGTRVVFVSPELNGVLTLWIMNADGTGVRPLVSAAQQHVDQPAWSPDGTRVAFRRWAYVGAPHDVWVVNADGSGATNLTEGMEGRQQRPTWSPRLADGSYRVAFAQVTQGPEYARARLWTVRADGGDRRALTAASDLHFDDEPAWSPDGNTVVFVRTGGTSHGDLWRVDAWGGGERPFVEIATSVQRSPAWSPDGRLLSFTSAHEIIGSRSGDHQIYTVGADGGGLVRVTSDPGDKVSPAWLLRR